MWIPRNRLCSAIVLPNSNTAGKLALSFFGTQLGPALITRPREVVWVKVSNHRKIGVAMSSIPLDFQRRCERRRSIMSGRNYPSGAIQEAWEKVGKQRWDGRTHGRGLGLLIVDAVTAQGTLILGRSKSPSQTFEFWRDQNKIRGRLIGVGNGVVVARLNVDGLPE